VTPRERVQAALAHSEPDFTPCDYFATPEIRQALLDYFLVKNDDEIRACLGTDLRYVNPPYTGPPSKRFDDGSTIDEWGVRRRPMPNEYGEYDEPVDFPYAAWESVDEAERFPWPDPDWYDYGAVPALCDQFPGLAVATGGFWVQDFINRVAMGRGVEQVLFDIATENPVYLCLVQKRHEFYMRQIERTLDAAGGRIDLVLCGDDFGTQRGLLISPATFDRLFAPKKKELFDLAHSFGAKVSHHCCGSSRQLIPHFIACGMDALQTIQPQAVGMCPYELKREFEGRIVLHGAVDVQGWLQRATVEEIEQEVSRLMDEVGRGGGFILAPCHHLQPDTPLENVLAIYRAVATRRGCGMPNE
jgi:uroporphyrinogen decarboxylase